MADPKVQGKLIVRDTTCTVSSHTWVYTGQFIKATDRCACGLYSWGEWQMTTARKGD